MTVNGNVMASKYLRRGICASLLTTHVPTPYIFQNHRQGSQGAMIRALGSPTNGVITALTLKLLCTNKMLSDKSDYVSKSPLNLEKGVKEAAGRRQSLSLTQDERTFIKQR